jgi:hypothetical protein
MTAIGRTQKSTPVDAQCISLTLRPSAHDPDRSVELLESGQSRLSGEATSYYTNGAASPSVLITRWMAGRSSIRCKY